MGERYISRCCGIVFFGYRAVFLLVYAKLSRAPGNTEILPTNKNRLNTCGLSAGIFIIFNMYLICGYKKRILTLFKSGTITISLAIIPSRLA